MSFKVVVGFYPNNTRAKAVLKKIPTIFSKPHLEDAPNGSIAVVAGEYERKDWANKAIHKLFEAGLMGGIWLI